MHPNHSPCGESCRYPSLEDIKGRGVSNALWKLIPQKNSRSQECRSVCVRPAVRDHESGLVTSSYCCVLWVKVLFWRKVKQWIYCKVHHNCFGLVSVLLNSSPFKGSQHCCDAASVFSHWYKSSSAVLSSFQLSHVDVCMCVPNRAWKKSCSKFPWCVEDRKINFCWEKQSYYWPS